MKEPTKIDPVREIELVTSDLPVAPIGTHESFL